MATNGWRRVPSGGEDHVRQRIGCIGRSLAVAVVRELDFFRAGVWTVAPEDTPDAAIVALLEGLSASVTVEWSVEAPVIDWLLHVLRATSASAVIFGVIDSRIDDRHVRGNPYAATLDLDVYTVVTGAQATFDVLESAFRWNISHIGAAILVQDVSEADIFEAPGVLRSDLPQTLSSRVAAAIVEAYDDEGVLVWSRDVTPGESA